LIIDLFAGSIENYISYTTNQSGGYDADFVFGQGWAVANRGAPVLFNLDLQSGHIDHFKYYYDDSESFKLMTSNVYIVKDYAFFFQEDGKVLCIPKGKNPLSSAETISLLMSWTEADLRSNLGIKNKYLELLSTGRFLVIDGINYPATDQNFREYLAAMGRTSTVIKQKNSNGSPVVGLSMLGEVYVRKDDSVLVLDQNGLMLSTISLAPLISSDDQERILDLYVHPNGDFYAMNAIKGDKVYIFKARRNWGHDLLRIAQFGVKNDREAMGLSAQMTGYTSLELRLLRNMVFAIHGYKFRSWDLKVYFCGYDWYKPQENQTNDISILADSQKWLMKLITEEEKRRK
jgi:hypothetical protein